MTTPTRSWYRVTLRDGRGPRRRNLALPTGLVRFSLFQTDPEADDAPSKRLQLTEADAEGVRATGLFDVEPAPPPKPGPLRDLVPPRPRELTAAERKRLDKTKDRPAKPKTKETADA